MLQALAVIQHQLQCIHCPCSYYPYQHMCVRGGCYLHLLCSHTPHAPVLLTSTYCRCTCTHSSSSTLDTSSTPATTSVAACITALTPVGPSMASGNQLWRPSTTLFTDTILITSMSTVLGVSQVCKSCKWDDYGMPYPRHTLQWDTLPVQQWYQQQQVRHAY